MGGSAGSRRLARDHRRQRLGQVVPAPRGRAGARRTAAGAGAAAELGRLAATGVRARQRRGGRPDGPGLRPGGGVTAGTPRRRAAPAGAARRRRHARGGEDEQPHGMGAASRLVLGGVRTVPALLGRRSVVAGARCLLSVARPPPDRVRRGVRAHRGADVAARAQLQEARGHAGRRALRRTGPLHQPGRVPAQRLPAPRGLLGRRPVHRRRGHPAPGRAAQRRLPLRAQHDVRDHPPALARLRRRGAVQP